MPYIIIKNGKSSGSKSAPVFQPHFNRSTGRYYHTSKDYYGDLKAKGLTPYDPSVPEPSIKKPEMSKEAKEIIQEIKNQSKNGVFKPSGKLIEKMVKMKAIHTKKAHHDAQKKAEKLGGVSGGFE